LLQHQLNIALMLVVKPGEADCDPIFTFANHPHPLAAQLVRIIHGAVEIQFQQSAALDIGVLQFQEHAGKAQTGDATLPGVVMLPTHRCLDSGRFSLV
jgi:hypothetical protein